MREINKKKLSSIKTKIINGQFSTMSKNWKEDSEYESALKILGNAMIKIEELYGEVD